MVLGGLVPSLPGGADADALAAPLLLAAALGAGSAAVALLVVPLPVPRASGAGAFRAGVRAAPAVVRDTTRLAAADPALRLLLTVTLPATTTPPPATTPDPDTVTITRAVYDSDKRLLRVEATSSRTGATLRVHVTSSDDLIGTLSGGAGQFRVGANPPSITVRSSLGGSATRTVTAK